LKHHSVSLTVSHFKLVRLEGLEPPCLTAPDPKSGMSTNFTTGAKAAKVVVLAFMPKKKCISMKIALLQTYPGFICSDLTIIQKRSRH
jgi:hypothetical protein